MKNQKICEDMFIKQLQLSQHEPSICETQNQQKIRNYYCFCLEESGCHFEKWNAEPDVLVSLN